MIDEHAAQLQACRYQYSRAIYRSIRDLIDPYVAPQIQLEYRRAVLELCEQTMERLAKDPLYFAKPDRALFQDIRRYFPITAQAEVAWADGGVARCRATTRKGKPCQRTPLPHNDYCPSHQHLEENRDGQHRRLDPCSTGTIHRRSRVGWERGCRTTRTS